MFIRNEGFKDFIKLNPVTSVIFAINVLLFLIMTIDGGTTNTKNLIKYGAFYKPFVLEGEYFRFISSMFVHIGFQHLLFNMFSLVIFAAVLERLIGNFKYIAIYLFSGVGGAIFVYFFSSGSLVAGASGALFGVFGTFLYIMMTNYLYIDEQSKQTFTAIFVLNVVFTFIGSGISVAGHLGGLFFGLILSFIILKKWFSLITNWKKSLVKIIVLNQRIFINFYTPYNVCSYSTHSVYKHYMYRNRHNVPFLNLLYHIYRILRTECMPKKSLLFKSNL